jgi:RNA polymerase-binding transcription factor DksA
MARTLKKKKTWNKGPKRKEETYRSRFLDNLMVKKEEVKDTLDRLLAEQEEYKKLAADDYLIDEMDHAARESSSQTHYILLERKHRELEKIEILMERALEEEEFGLCEECGEKIPEERLMIMPEATRCVPCQRESERTGLKTGFMESHHNKLGEKRELHWGPGEDNMDIGRLSFKPDFEGMTFLDSDDFDTGDNQGFNSPSGPAGRSTT